MLFVATHQHCAAAIACGKRVRVKSRCLRPAAVML
jgi:hypothetical protein